MERWLEERYAEVCSPGSGCGNEERFRILGYQWRALRFNDDTRQSTVKVMSAYRESEPASICLMQQPHCLAVPCTYFFTPFSCFCCCYYAVCGLLLLVNSINLLTLGEFCGTHNIFEYIYSMIINERLRLDGYDTRVLYPCHVIIFQKLLVLLCCTLTGVCFCAS